MDFSHNKQVRFKSRKFCIEYAWIIENLDLIRSAKSPIFSAENDTRQWILEIKNEPLGAACYATTNIYDYYINVFLKEANGTLEKNDVISGILELTVENEKYETRLQDSINTNKLVAEARSKFYRGRCKLPKGELKIICKLSYILVDKTNQDSPIITIPAELPESDAIDSEHYFKSEECSDVAIYLDDKKYPAHKFVLAARSPVFKAMFAHQELKENQQNRIDIKDIDEKIFERMLSYMYTGKIGTLMDIANAFELLLAADKYNVEKLKVRCEIEIFNMLSVGTVVKTLLFSDTHNLSNLKKNSILYIKEHLTEMKESEYWKDITSLRQDLLIDILKV